MCLAPAARGSRAIPIEDSPSPCAAAKVPIVRKNAKGPEYPGTPGNKKQREKGNEDEDTYQRHQKKTQRKRLNLAIALFLRAVCFQS